MTTLLPPREAAIHAKILALRGQRVMLDADIAELYRVTTSRLNQHHLRRLRFAPTLPLAFTEHGTLMLASVLNSDVAVRTSIAVIRAFIRMREALGANRDLAAKVDLLERKYDGQFKVVFDAIRALMKPSPIKKSRRIGFRPDR